MKESKYLQLLKKAPSIHLTRLLPSTPQTDTLLLSLCLQKILPVSEEYRTSIFCFLKSFNKVMNQNQAPENKVKTLGRCTTKFRKNWQLWEDMSCSERIQTFK